MSQFASTEVFAERWTTSLKVPLFVAASLFVTFALFAVMSELVNHSESYQEPVTEPILVAIANVKDDSDTRVIKPALPQPPQTKPVPRPAVEPTTTEVGEQLIANSNLTLVNEFTIDQGISSSGPKDMQALPVVRVPPNYPAKAASQGIEGWVQLSFSIDEIGRVFDVQVVDAEPKRIFNQAAKKALRKWKYKPSFAEGKAVVQQHQSIVLEFKMDNS